MYELKLVLSEVQDVDSIRAGLDKVILAAESRKDFIECGSSGTSTEALHVQTKTRSESKKPENTCSISFPRQPEKESF